MTYVIDEKHVHDGAQSFGYKPVDLHSDRETCRPTIASHRHKAMLERQLGDLQT